MSSLLYGTGMRLMECLRLRVKDVDFARNEITVRDGKGGKDRRTVLPKSLWSRCSGSWSAPGPCMRRTAGGIRAVWLPHALARKYPNAARDLAGNTCSRRRSGRSTRATAWSAATTSTTVLSRALKRGRRGGHRQAGLVPTRFGTPSPPT